MRIHKPRLQQPSETLILHNIRQVLRWHGFYVIRIQQGLGCHKGISDLIALKAGKVYFIEVKKPTGKLSEYQERFQAEVKERGCNYVVVRCVEDVKEILTDEKEHACNTRTLDG
jgi:hypothetical protein